MGIESICYRSRVTDRRTSKRWLLVISTLCSIWLAGCASTGVSPAPVCAGEPAVVILVRHAEKASPPFEGEPSDPPLNAEGRVRAETLAALLADAGLDHIHSSDYRRTRETAMPLARKLGLTVERYDAGNLEELASRLKREGGRHLVVGHSNTTPRLAGLLGGDPGEPIEESLEFDRLYVLTLDSCGAVMTIMLRYGD
ncbi:MAG TPA: histidine phosphatase family protein [Thermoanaerobaculia bacterium]|nr:histidine phosphatase family protein [Thermoanaerobaculia bacterium]